MDEKKSNLSVAVDTTSADELLRLVEQVGPSICLLKTHIDIIEDFTAELVVKLRQLAEKHNFMIFEDRKFADIGNTVRLQYGSGIYRIAEWSEITNAHMVPGPGIIEGLQEVGLPKGNGLLLLAQMSSKGNLAINEYCKATIEVAEEYNEFVIGFISRQRLSDNPAFLHMTPGVKLAAGDDRLGQQYITPYKAIVEHENDIIIVGRGIIHATDPAQEAKTYQEAGWSAYLQRI